MIHLADYDYHLPDFLIAQQPLEKRENSQLLVYDQKSEKMDHRHFYDIASILKPGDSVVINDSKVIPARLWGKKAKSETSLEFLWLGEDRCGLWRGLLRGRHPLGCEIVFNEGSLKAKVYSKNEDGTTDLEVGSDVDAITFLSQHGCVPLPPYIKRKPCERNFLDQERYQTVFAKPIGSVAAPTAGLHFSEELVSKLRTNGIKFIPITLRVGLGTFQPVKADALKKHRLHLESYEISDRSAHEINEAIGQRSRIFVIGTTTARALESSGTDEGYVKAGKGATDLFIYPPYSFKIVRNLVTNFHLPRSSLLMLVAALVGREKILNIYREAIQRKYRFYSYGDAMLILADSQQGTAFSDRSDINFTVRCTLHAVR